MQDFSHPSWRLLPWLACHHTAASNRLKQLLDLRGAMDKLVGPELEGWVLDQLNEGDQQAPGVGPVHNQPLQQHPANANVEKDIRHTQQIKNLVICSWIASVLASAKR